MARTIEKGTTIERYRVQGRLGAGSMGEVYLGVDIGLDREVALKILSERHRDNRELRARFVREAKAVAAISHPNVVQVFATGTFDGRPYIAMEFLDGTDLGSSIEEHGHWSSLQAARAVLDAAQGLRAAAEAGLIHRDVKPANLVLVHDGTVKVTDFGLAKPIDPGDQPALTALGVVVGTPDYIAPEQAKGDKIDHRVDIYALGGTLYYLLTGMPPFRTGRAAEDKYLKVVARHIKNPAPDPRVRVSTIDRQLSRLGRRMMAKKPDERPDYEVLVEQLTAIIQRLERESGPVVPLGKARHSTGLGGQSSPTPMVRDVGPAAVGSPGGRPGSAAPARLDHTPRAASAPPAASVLAPSPTAPEDDDAAPTKVHMPSMGAPRVHSSPAISVPGGSRSSVPDSSYSQVPAAGSGIPRWLWVLTALSVTVFLAGVLVKLVGPIPTSESAPASEPGPSSPTGAAAPIEPAPVPEGMLMVARDDGSPWFLVDRAPVSNAAYAAIFPKHATARQAGDRPVTQVSHSYARSYARAVGKRLLTSAEWSAASQAEGVVLAKGRWEWVAQGAGEDGDERPVRSPEGSASRPGAGGKDVTFRLAQDMAPAAPSTAPE